MSCKIGYCPGCATGSCPKIKELQKQLEAAKAEILDLKAGDGVIGD